MPKDSTKTMKTTVSRKSKKKNNKWKSKSELGKKIWAVTDGVEILGINLTYRQAELRQRKHSKATIITDKAVLRMKS